MRIKKLSFVVVCVIFAISSFQGIAYSQKQVVVVPLISNRLQGISPNDVVQLGTDSCTVNSYCGMGLRWPEEGLNFSGGVPEGKYLVINSVSIQPSNPGTGVMVGAIVQKKQGDQYYAPRIRWTVTNGWGEVMNFSPGVIINSGNNLWVYNSNLSEAFVNVEITGYLIDK